MEDYNITRKKMEMIRIAPKILSYLVDQGSETKGLYVATCYNGPMLDSDLIFSVGDPEMAQAEATVSVRAASYQAYQQKKFYVGDHGFHFSVGLTMQNGLSIAINGAESVVEGVFFILSLITRAKIITEEESLQVALDAFSPEYMDGSYRAKSMLEKFYAYRPSKAA